jgi:glycine/D-amino acid oxidase-like deaminating enzyme
VKIRSKEPYWLLRNGIINSYPSLRKNIKCDVLIIGGGITGALVSYRLSRDGYKTVVIDKRDIGTGSTSATTSMVQYELDEPLYGLMDTIGRKAAVDIYTAGVNAIHQLGEIANDLPGNCGFNFKASLHFAETAQDAAGLMKEFECRKMAGIKVDWLTKEQINARYGVISEGGILSETAASMDAYQLTHALLEHSIKNYGVEVYDHTALESVEYSDDKNFVIVDTAAQIECSTIVYATGYESHDFIKKGIGKLISTYACISEPFEQLPAALADTVFWNTQDPYFYFRTTFDNRILIGGVDENFKNPEKRDACIEKKEEALVRTFGQKLPGVDFVADFSWAGTFGVTKDSLPYIGSHPDFPNTCFMLGFGGNGITFSVMGMDIISDAIGKRPNKFLEYFKFNR